MSELSILLDRLEDEYKREEAGLAAKQATVENLRQQISLLKQLIALRDGERMPKERAFGLFQAAPPSTGSISELVRDLLNAHGDPMHISEIRQALISQGHSIPGRGTDANIIAHISRDDSIARVGKGTYALAAWGLPAIPRRKRRAKKRARRTGERSQ
jgi:hypothetical protein